MVIVKPRQQGAARCIDHGFFWIRGQLADLGDAPVVNAQILERGVRRSEDFRVSDQHRAEISASTASVSAPSAAAGEQT